MARAPRFLVGNVVYHVFNRRTDKQCLFGSAAAYGDFLGILQAAKTRYPVRFHSYCLVGTHWHLAASAEDPRVLSATFRWIATTHAVRFRFDTATRGHGHVYQDRFKAVAVLNAIEYVRLVRYIERNPVEATLVSRAERWRWSSLYERLSGRCVLIEPGPWRLPDNWLEIVNSCDAKIELEPSLLGQLSSFRPPPSAFPERT
jgi:putative transposase